MFPAHLAERRWDIFCKHRVCIFGFKCNLSHHHKETVYLRQKILLEFFLSKKYSDALVLQWEFTVFQYCSFLKMMATPLPFTVAPFQISIDKVFIIEGRGPRRCQGKSAASVDDSGAVGVAQCPMLSEEDPGHGTGQRHPNSGFYNGRRRPPPPRRAV